VLRLTSANPTRMQIGDGAFEEQRVTVAAGHSQSVKFTTSAKANGRAAVIAQLYTEDGQAYGPAVTFDVKVNELTPTVLLVIAGGVLLLVLAGFRMYTQRKRAAARQAEEAGEESAGDESAGDELNGDGSGAVDTEGTTGSTDDSTHTERDARHDAETPEDSGGGPEHPGEPAPDTASGNAGPSATGERVDR
jgi:hypothetical protein